MQLGAREFGEASSAKASSDVSTTILHLPFSEKSLCVVESDTPAKNVATALHLFLTSTSSSQTLATSFLSLTTSSSFVLRLASLPRLQTLVWKLQSAPYYLKPQLCTSPLVQRDASLRNARAKFQRAMYVAAACSAALKSSSPNALFPCRKSFALAPLPLLVLVLSALPAAQASVGDRSPAYQRCLSTCTSACPSSPPSKLTLWPCAHECRYTCLTFLTDLALGSSELDHALQGQGGALEGLPIGRMVQFNGKWPFYRMASVQEPLSVLFSLANLWAHWRGWRDLGKMGYGAEGLRKAYRIYALSGINTWIWSSVFHIRDVDWTEKADYFSAAGGMLCGLWIAGVRLGGLYGSANAGNGRRGPRSAIRRGWALLCSTIFVAHCLYLASGDRFDYGYNMRFNVTVALAQIILWAAWSAYHQFLLSKPSPFLAVHPSTSTKPTRAPHSHLPLLPVLLLPALTALELLDFAPIGPFGLRMLDAHALWHLSTVAVVRMWYGFLEKDLRWVEGYSGTSEEVEGGRSRVE